jgi:hypothetical protein
VAVVKQNLTADLFYDDGGGADWQPVPVYTRDAVQITRGLSPESLEPLPGSADLTADNTGGEYNPGHPESPLYGRVGTHTPIRVLEGTSTRLTGEVDVYAPRRTVEPVDNATGRGDAWTVMTAAGILRRIGKGVKPLRAPLERAITAEGPALYWPLSDGAGATVAGTPLAGGAALPITGAPLLGTVPGFDGDRSTFPNLVRGDEYSGGFEGPITGIGASGFTWEGWIFATPADSSTFAAANPARVYLSGSTLPDTGDEYISLSIIVNTPDPEPTLDLTIGNIASGSVSTGSTEFGDSRQWHHFRFTIIQMTASTVDIELYFDGVLVDFSVGAAAVIGTPVWFDAAGSTLSGFDVPDNLSVLSLAHVAFWDTPDPSLTPTEVWDAGNGYRGERAGTRFLRVLGEFGITAALSGLASDTQRMGPQPSDTLMEIVKECARTDGGFIVEDRVINRLVLFSNYDLCNQAVVLALDFTAGHVAPPLHPIFGGRIRNDVTATNRNGSSARVVLEAGPNSVQDPPDGAGRVDTELKVNVDDDARLVDAAGWHLAIWSTDEVRYDTVTVDLSGVPALKTAATNVDIGNLISIGGHPDAPGTSVQMVIGTLEHIPSNGRKITYRCIPGSPWFVGVIVDVDTSIEDFGQRVDTDSSTLAAAAADTDTELVVVSSGDVLWTTDADNWTVTDLIATVGGEDVQVTEIASSALDAFGRTVAGGWGAADVGGAWTVAFTAAQYAVSSGTGRITPDTVTSNRFASLTSTGPDRRVRSNVMYSALPASGTLIVGLCPRLVDTSNYYLAEMRISTAGVVTLRVSKRVAGTPTTLVDFIAPDIYVAGAFWTVEVQADGDSLRAKAWPVAGAEPLRWQIETTDSSLASGSLVSCYARNDTAVTTHTAQFDAFEVVNPQTMTVVRSLNGVSKAQAAGASVHVRYPIRIGR